MTIKTEKMPKGIEFEAVSKFPKEFESLSDREKKYF